MSTIRPLAKLYPPDRSARRVLDVWLDGVNADGTIEVVVIRTGACRTVDAYRVLGPGPRGGRFGAWLAAPPPGVNVQPTHANHPIHNVLETRHVDV